MDALTIARAAHVLAVVTWIGGVAFVTLVLLPALRNEQAASRMDMFERLERRFARQAKLSVVIAGLSGFYMTRELMAWDRFLDIRFWWMHAMVAVWLIFATVLFVAEPLFLHAWFHRYARENPDGSFRVLQRMHYVLLTVSLVTVAAAVLGAHGAIP
jgi:uncharacterized membrane protein